MDIDQALKFADHWLESWNSHDLDKIMSHYSDDFVMSSPIIVSVMNEPSGTLKGKVLIREYWSRALTKYPDLQFEKLNVLLGANSVTIIYLGVRGLSAEVFHFNSSGLVHSAYAHYNS
jgi:ketosteroid isomerase-like protein